MLISIVYSKTKYMQTNLKYLSLFVSLLLVFSFGATAQTPKINGIASYKAEMVPQGYAKRFEASGCPLTGDSLYVWEYRGGTSGTFDLVSSWNSAYKNGSGLADDGNKVLAETVQLGNDGRTGVMQYRVSCTNSPGVLKPANTKAVIELRVVPSNFTPTMYISEIKCGAIGTNAGGYLRINSGGECTDGYYWVDANNRPFTEDGDAILEGNFANGRISLSCVYNNVADTDGSQGGQTSFHNAIGAKRWLDVKKYYAPPVPSTTNLLMVFKNPEYQAKITNGNSKVDVCPSDEVFVSALRISENISAYSGFYDFNFAYRTPESQGVFLTLPDGTNGATQARANVSGVYGIRIEDRQMFNGRPACLAQPFFVDNARINGTPGLEVKVQTVVKPSITSVTNFNVCPDGSTSLVAAGATNPKSYTWTFNDVQIADNSSDNLSINSTGNAKVFYVSNLTNSLGSNCSSASSDVVAIAAFPRPSKPTVSSSGRTSYCEYLSISDRLTAVSDQAVAWAWSTGGTTKEVTANAFGSYTVQITDANGCTASSDPFSITKIARPAAPSVAMAAGSLDLNCVLGANGSPTAIGLVVSNPEDAKFSYQWFTTNSETALGSGSALNGVTGNATGSVTYYAIRTDKTTNCFSDREASKVTGKRLIFQANPVDNAAKVSKEAYAMKVNFASSLGGATAGAHEWKYGNTTLPETGEKANAFNANGGNGDYTVRRNYTYSIEGRSLVCWSNSVKYTYVADPDFAGVIVYPNPTNAEVKVSVLDQATWANANVLIYDMAGRLLYSGTLSGSAIQTNNLGNGVYVLNIRSNNGEKTFQTKLVVNK